MRLIARRNEFRLPAVTPTARDASQAGRAKKKPGRNPCRACGAVVLELAA